MDMWVKNLIGLAVVLILIVFALKLHNSVSGEVVAWDFSAKFEAENNTVPEALPVDDPGPKECRLPEHGIESWNVIDTITTDSGWRKGGSSPGEFCAAQLIGQQARHSGKEVVLVSKDEKHKSEYTPFKHDYYRYACLFEIKEPIYHLAPNSKCQ